MPSSERLFTVQVDRAFLNAVRHCASAARLRSEQLRASAADLGIPASTADAWLRDATLLETFADDVAKELVTR